MPTDFGRLFSILSGANVRFIVAGGLAVLLHGIDRLTADVDVILDLATEPVQSAVTALAQAGYRPMAPVNAHDLADPAVRARWQREHQMQVFSFWDTANAMPTVDVMLETPIAFEALWHDAAVMNLHGVAVHVASISHLIQMKQQAGRPQDLADIEALQRLTRP